jgi:hypothetical protein
MDRMMLSPTAPRATTALPLQRTLLAGLLALAFAAGLIGLGIVLGAGSASTPVRAAALMHAGKAPPAPSLSASLSAALGAADPAYRVRVSGAGLSVANPAQSLRAGFTRGGVSLRSGALRVDLSLHALRAGGTTRGLGAVTPSAHANTLAYARAGVREWYVNGPLGLEQGFTVMRPGGARAGGGERIALTLALGGNARAALGEHGQSVTFARGGGQLRYGELSATDASGRRLHSRLSLGAGALVLHVDARGARYPLRIDPLVQQGAKIRGEDSEGRFGYSVAISADGNTALVGARRSNTAGQAAWVFTRTGLSWSEQAALTVSEEEAETCEAGETTECGFGRSVALSGDGNTALIGAPAADEHRGAAWVFTRTGTIWSQQPGRLTAAEENARGHFGVAVALSANGDIAVIGGPADHGHRGSAWVFTNGGSGWAESAKLVGTGTGEGSYFGRSVAISADAGTLLIGGSGDAQNTGAAWVFGALGSSWAQRGLKLTGAGESGEGRFGYSVALSSDGATALVGGRNDGSGAGAAWVFQRKLGSGYLPQSGKLTGTEESGAAQLGYSAALSASGDTALLGGPRDAESTGAAWVFTRSSAAWSQQGGKLTGAGASGKAWFGASAALAADARTALIGGFHDNSGAGASWVFRDNTLVGEEPPSEEPPGEKPSAKGSPGPTVTTTPTVTVLAGSGVLGGTFVSLPAPTLAVTGNLTPLSGKVLVKLPGSNHFIALGGALQVPFGTIIDARHGKVSLTTARPGGGTQTVTFYEGMFRITQARSGRVTAALVGGDFSVCPTAAERRHLAHASATRRKHTVRKLWAEGHGSYSTKGNYATGAVLGTRWLTEDRCDGTLIRVLTDKVSVRNLVNHRQHTVHAGRSYLAKAPG